MSKIYDAVGIEYAFARIVGNEIGARGTECDADVFRAGRPSNLSEALSSAIDAIENRISDINFTNEDHESGGIAAQLEVAMKRLSDIADQMTKMSQSEPNDYHWVIVASLLTVINTLLVVLERKS